MELSVTANDVARFERGATPPKVTGWHVTVTRKAHIDELAVLLAESPGTCPARASTSTGETVMRSSRGIASGADALTAERRSSAPANVREGAP